MATLRINVRLPRDVYERLKAQSESAGYSSLNQLARCVLVQFVRHSERMRKATEMTSWMEEMTEGYDPRVRKQINERL